MKTLLPKLCLAVLLAAAWPAWGQEGAPQSPAAPSLAPGKRCFEVRTYNTHPGRLEALHRRFREHTNGLFVKHGMTLVGYWVPDDKPDTLVYILAYPDREARERSWKAFMDDPEWKKAYEESHKDGPIVSKVEFQFLQATDYSPVQ